jgi:hypothetical protein
MCRSTCFGLLHAHHQELTAALKAFVFTLDLGGSSVVGRGLEGYNLPDHVQQHCYKYAATVKTEAVNAAVSS